MVKQEKYRGNKIFSCEECGFGYKEKAYARKCEDFCKTHSGCSLEITKHAVKK